MQLLGPVTGASWTSWRFADSSTTQLSENNNLQTPLVMTSLEPCMCTDATKTSHWLQTQTHSPTMGWAGLAGGYCPSPQMPYFHRSRCTLGTAGLSLSCMKAHAPWECRLGTPRSCTIALSPHPCTKQVPFIWLVFSVTCIMHGGPVTRQ